MKLSFLLSKNHLKIHVKQATILGLSIIMLTQLFPLDVHAETTNEYEAAAESRKSLEIQSNQISNWPAGPAIGSEGAILMDADSGAILYAKNIDEKLYPASTTKMLTCLLAAEKCSMDEIVNFSHEAVFTVPVGGSNMGMDEGQYLPMEECLYGILVGSANEVANAVAEHVGGSLDGFAEMMNQRAAELGCTNTHFVNANGLYDDNHYTSCHDLALIAQAFFNNELLCKIGNTARYSFEPTAGQPDEFTLINKHKFITGELSYTGVMGGKTGYTDEARQTLVTGVKQNGMRLICVVMKEESPAQFTDTQELFDYGFSNFTKVNVSENDTSYVINNANFFKTDNDVFGDSNPILSMNSNDSITLPNTIDFKDTTSELTYNVTGENEVAVVNYSYNGAFLGSASIELAPDSASEYDFSTPPVKMEEENPKSKETSNTIIVNVKKVLLWVILAACVLIVIFILLAYYRNLQYQRKRRKRLNRHKASRRRRSRHDDLNF